MTSSSHLSDASRVKLRPKKKRVINCTVTEQQGLKYANQPPGARFNCVLGFIGTAELDDKK